MASQTSPSNVLILGGGGYIGRLVTAALARPESGVGQVISADIRLPDPADRVEGAIYATADIRDPALADLMAEHHVGSVVHLATNVSPGRKADRELEYSIDVLGTQNVLEGCLKAGVGQIVIASSGAAYGYHADNPAWLTETDALRGNPEFAYSDHKRLVEEMLAGWREEHPRLKQLILRPGTVLGRATRNQITDLFDKPVILGLTGAATPFVFIWDQDVVEIIAQGVRTGAAGIFNLAGDGVVTMKQIARLLGKVYLPLPTGLVQGALWVLKRLGLTQYGPEQVNFLRYRPVLDNQRLKEEFGYTPRKTSRQVFDLFLEGRGCG